jgi:hypothetical protein
MRCSSGVGGAPRCSNGTADRPENRTINQEEIRATFAAED